jgi:hypothetical protein
MAYNFNGTSQYLSTASAPASGTPMTIAAWCRGPVGAGGRAVAAVGVNAGTHRNQLNMNGTTVQVFSQGATAGHTHDTGTIASTGALFHFAGVFSSSSSRTGYINGVAGTTGIVDVGSQNAANTITIGARWNTSIGNYYDNDIAEVGVWNVELTAAEIASLAKGMTCDKVRPQSLVFYAPLVRNLQDVRGGLTITNNNGVLVAVHPRVFA